MNPEHSSQSRLALQITAVALLCLQALCPVPVIAEEALTLLTIEGDLIGRIDALDPALDSAQIIDAYYALLTPELRQQVDALHEGLIALIPAYEVAFIAADSAEITEVKSDIDFLWAGIRTIHAQHFIPDVVGLLNSAYDSAFSSLGLKPAETEALP